MRDCCSTVHRYANCARPSVAIEGTQGDLVANCEVICECVTKVTLDRALMSSTIRAEVVYLLQRILEVNPEYGQKSEMESVRTQFIGLLADGDVHVSREPRPGTVQDIRTHGSRDDFRGHTWSPD